MTATFIAAWFFPILWNVIAMEAAACYVGECRGGARDAKIALTAEGLFGMFIYIMTPLMFVAVLGLSLSTLTPLTLYVSFTQHIFGAGSWVKWFVGIPLIAALALSVLNAIMGVGRSLYQAAEDGVLPRWFERKNKHGVPGDAMAFNVVCSGTSRAARIAARIYIISNGGYLLSCTLAFGGYFVYRHLRPDEPRPFRLPTFAKWGALGVFIVWTVIYFWGGWNSPDIVVGKGQGPWLYLLGLLIVALYAPLYWWRRWQDRKLAAVAPTVTPLSGGRGGQGGGAGTGAAAISIGEGCRQPIRSLAFGLRPPGRSARPGSRSRRDMPFGRRRFRSAANRSGCGVAGLVGLAVQPGGVPPRPRTG